METLQITPLQIHQAATFDTDCPEVEDEEQVGIDINQQQTLI